MQCILLACLVTGCSWFGGNKKGEESHSPTPLQKINAEIQVDLLWQRKIGNGAEDRALKLIPGIVGGQVFAAAADGALLALDAATGRKIWKINIKDFYDVAERRIAFSAPSDVITAGVGVGEGLVLVGSAAGEVVAVNQSDGSLAWRAHTTSEVLAPPQIYDQLVVAQSIDGKVTGFDALEGERQWLYATSIPSLTLRGTSTPLVADVVIAAFANGRIVILDKALGLPVLQQRVAAAKGKSDLERLVDIDGLLIREGAMLYVASYQGNLVSIDLANDARIRWSKPASSIVGIGSGFGHVYLATADSEIQAFDAITGQNVWESVELRYRDITAPVTISSYIAVGDVKGYVHLLAQVDGRFVARKRLGSNGISSPVVADGSRLYIMGNGGRLTALTLR